MNKLMTKITTKMGKVGLILKKYEPEILVISGAIGAVGSTVLACRATLKVSEVLDEHKDTINTIHDAIHKQVDFQSQLNYFPYISGYMQVLRIFDINNQKFRACLVEYTKHLSTYRHRR